MQFFLKKNDPNHYFLLQCSQVLYKNMKRKKMLTELFRSRLNKSEGQQFRKIAKSNGISTYRLARLALQEYIRQNSQTAA